ncbi:DUF6355 family natural product biosynthesis protein [Streptosporangium sp. NPDC001559]|uniref:DUF6355 family natural product biosynthesis protein n=1 Tax=Streptosporangium sp. NPDC001559 TaxID=3366187 RepID=UPI0036E9FDAB
MISALKRQKKSIALGIAALSTLGVLATSGTASASSTAETKALACGWDPTPALAAAYYNHCDPSTHVLIRVERTWPLSDYDQCVGPGRTYLGTTYEVHNAWYKGSLC